MIKIIAAVLIGVPLAVWVFFMVKGNRPDRAGILMVDALGIRRPVVVAQEALSPVFLAIKEVA